MGNWSGMVVMVMMVMRNPNQSMVEITCRGRPPVSSMAGVLPGNGPRQILANGIVDAVSVADGVQPGIDPCLVLAIDIIDKSGGGSAGPG